MAKKKEPVNTPPMSIVEVIDAFRPYQEQVDKGLYSFQMYVPVLTDAKKFQGLLGAFKQNILRRSKQGKLTVEELAWYKLIAPYGTKVMYDDQLELTRRYASTEEDDAVFDGFLQKGGARVYSGYSERNRTAWDKHTDLLLETCVDKHKVIQVDLNEVMLEVPDDFELTEEEVKPSFKDTGSVDELF